MSLKWNDLNCIAKARDDVSLDDIGIKFESQHEIPDKWTKPIVTYCLIRGSDDISDDKSERIAMNLAMTTWDFEIPLTLKVVKKTENPDITVEFTDSEHDSFFKDDPSILAYAYFPNSVDEGIIKFNDDKNWSLDGRSIHSSAPGELLPTKTYNLHSTLIHEIGHSLGLSHSQRGIDEDEYTDQEIADTVMHPMYNGRLDLSEYDVRRIVKKYGARQWTSSEHYDRVRNWLHHRIRRTESFIPASVAKPSVELELKKELNKLKKELIGCKAVRDYQIKVISDLASKLREKN